MNLSSVEVFFKFNGIKEDGIGIASFIQSKFGKWKARTYIVPIVYTCKQLLVASVGWTEPADNSSTTCCGS